MVTEEKKVITKQTHAQTNLKKKLSFKEQREFDMLEKELAELVKEKKDISDKLGDADISFDELQKLSKRIAEITVQIDDKELRWLELSE